MPPAAEKSFYVTTPIYYVNDAPHIGHAYTTVMGDIITRWHRQRGEDVWYLTGTDEHGLKVLRKARGERRHAAGVGRPADRDRVDARCWRRSTSPTTTSSAPPSSDISSGSKAFWQDLYDRGAVYQGEFSGYYSVGSEEFVGDDDVVDGEGDDEGFKVSALDGSRVEHMTEENYFFKLLGVPAAAARLLRGQPRLHPAGVGAQRDRRLRAPRPQGPVHVAVDVRLGHPGALGRRSTSCTSGSRRCSTT